MSSHLIIDGNAVYEVDEDCMKGNYMRGDWQRGSRARRNWQRREPSGEGGCQNWGCCSKEK